MWTIATSKGKGGGDKKSSPKEVPKKPFNGKGKPKSSGCFLCDGDHRVRDCPQRKALNTVRTEEDKEKQMMGAMRLLNAGQPKVAKPVRKELIYVNIRLNGKPATAMVDTGRRSLKSSRMSCLLSYRYPLPYKLLPPRGEVDHRIELEPGAKPPALAGLVHHRSWKSFENNLRSFLMLATSNRPKHHTGHRCCFKRSTMGAFDSAFIDYRALNKVTIKQE